MLDSSIVDITVMATSFKTGTSRFFARLTLLLELVRYIHLNPIRAGIVSSLEELKAFAYAGHSGIFAGNPPKWQAVYEVLSRFDQRRIAVARQQYEAYLAEGVIIGKRTDLIGGGLVRSAGGWEHISLARRFGEHLKSDERILGDSDFVEEVLGRAQEHMDRISLYREKGFDLGWVAQKVAEVLEIEISEIWKEGKKAETVQARSLLCYWAIKELGMTAVAVAKQVKLTDSGVIRAAQRGEQLVAQRGWSLS